uniref:Uncharacterized protein n=1 Tax=Arundo donax TaxID=35708 RepID=A0A0A9DT82_ARUDO
MEIIMHQLFYFSVLAFNLFWLRAFYCFKNNKTMSRGEPLQPTNCLKFPFL